MDNTRYTDMRACAIRVGAELESFEALAIRQCLHPSIIHPVKSRLERTPLRAYFISKMYAYLKACPDFKPQNTNLTESIFNQKIPFIYEVIITIQYLHNQILDGKSGIVSSEKINDHLLIGNQLKDLLYDYIEESFPATIASRVTKNVRAVFRYVDIGQRMEKKWNTYAAFQSSRLAKATILPPFLESFIRLEDAGIFLNKLENDLPEEKVVFAKTYLQRIYLTCAALFKLGVQLILDLTEYKGQEYKNLLQFAGCYGLMRQIVNDNADYIPSYFQLSTKGKEPFDAFSDLKNRNVTLPMIYYLAMAQQHSQPLINYLEEKEQTIPEEEVVYDEMLNSHALLQSIQNVKLLGLTAKSYLNPNNSMAPFIADSCKIAEWNKFVFPCYKSNQYKYYKKTSHYKETKNALRDLKKSLDIQHEEPASGGIPTKGTSGMQGY